MQNFEVKRAHWGDRDGERHRFMPGERRSVDPAAVTGLIKAGALVPVAARKIKETPEAVAEEPGVKDA